MKKLKLKCGAVFMDPMQRRGDSSGYLASGSSSDSDSLGNWEPRRRTAVAAQSALATSPTTTQAAATSSEMRFRGGGQQQELVLFSPLFAQQQLQIAREPLLQQLRQSERNLASDNKEDSSWCDCFSTPPSHGWRLRNGQAETYSEPGGFLADTASYQPGVAGAILRVLGDDQLLKRYPLTLHYLLKHEAKAVQADEDAVKRLFKLSVEMKAAEPPQSSEGLLREVSRELWPSYHNIYSVLGREKILEIVQEVEQNTAFARAVLEADDLRMEETPYQEVTFNPWVACRRPTTNHQVKVFESREVVLQRALARQANLQWRFVAGGGSAAVSQPERVSALVRSCYFETSQHPLGDRPFFGAQEEEPLLPAEKYNF